MKVIVLSYTDNVGKTTLSCHMLSSRMGNPPIFSLKSNHETKEKLDWTNVSFQEFYGSEYQKLFVEILMQENAIIDVGASMITSFLNYIVKFKGLYTEFDYFIIPITSGDNEQILTIKMIRTLEKIGIEPIKIRLIFNKVISDVNKEFGIFFNATEEIKTKVNRKAAIFENELFDLLAIHKLSLFELIDDKNNYKLLLQKNRDADEKIKIEWVKKLSMMLLLSGLKINLDYVYEETFNEYT